MQTIVLDMVLDMTLYAMPAQQFRSAGEKYLERARSRKGVPQYIQLHGLLSRGKHSLPLNFMPIVMYQNPDIDNLSSLGAHRSQSTP